MSEDLSLTVRDNEEQSRFEVVDEAGVVAGFAEYQKQGGLMVFTHTEVDDAFEGQGVGSTLMRGALDQTRSFGLPVRAVCPFVASYIDKHPEYRDLLTS